MTDADAYTIALHAISHERRDVLADEFLTDKERAERLDELDNARDHLRELRRPLVAIPTLPHVKGGESSAGSTPTTPTADAECAGPGDGID